MDTPPAFQIKGIREGLLVTLGEGEWEALQAALLKHVDEQSAFLKGARLALEVGARSLRAAELGGLRDALSERGLSLWAVLSESPKTEQNAQALGLATKLHKAVAPAPRPATKKEGEEDAVLVRRTLRSGASVQFAGHVVVIGDVNPGAEVIAAGNIVVWGRLRGMAHAGAEGDESAIVCALDLAPTQLRIAGKAATAPQRRGKPQPEMALLKDGQVTAQGWDTKGKG
ncbi:MAG: septum site-determining protein MinC [Chloroflexi bacterium]|nr:septum site-determining protein MinC [Chloroflexota bacterium]